MPEVVTAHVTHLQVCPVEHLREAVPKNARTMVGRGGEAAEGDGERRLLAYNVCYGPTMRLAEPSE